MGFDFGRRPSGAKLYHRHSEFGKPRVRKLDRNVVARILFAAEALDRRTRGRGQHGGVLKGKGLDVLRALLRRFYNHKTGICFPSYAAIAEAAGCCEETVRRKLRELERLGLIETLRRKVVARFVDREARVSIDYAVQTSNSYVFNYAWPDRGRYGDLALPLLRPKPEGSLADPKLWGETSLGKKDKGLAALHAALEAWRRVFDEQDGAG